MTDEGTRAADQTFRDVSRAGPGREYPGTPRWVKISGIIALLLVLLVVVMLLFGGGNHGPGRHMPSGGAGGQLDPVTAIASGER